MIIKTKRQDSHNPAFFCTSYTHGLLGVVDYFRVHYSCEFISVKSVQPVAESVLAGYQERAFDESLGNLHFPSMD